MIDQIRIGEKYSYDDFEASVSKRAIQPPKKKTIKETVPFSNTTYDFTAINGEIYWEEREIDYEFEIIAPTAERLERIKVAFSNWIMNIMQEELHEPLIPDYHFIVTYDDMSFEDDEMLEKTTATVKFKAYPFKIANYAKEYEIKDLSGSGFSQVCIENNSGHRITPTFTVIFAEGEQEERGAKIGVIDPPDYEEQIEVFFNDKEYLIEAGVTKDDVCKLEIGTNILQIYNQHIRRCDIKITFYEEVL